MESDTIYQIILSVLADEATDEEYNTLQSWLEASDANLLEFEKIKRLYHVSTTTEKKQSQIYNVDQAWKQIYPHTVGQRRRYSLKTWLPYAAMLLLAFGIGYYLMPDPAIPGCVGEVNPETFDEPILLLDNGEKIRLNQDSFSIQRENTVIRNNTAQLSYQADAETANEEDTGRNHIMIPKGNAYELVLADGTHVWLNAESELTFPTRFTGKERRVALKGEAYFDVSKNPDKPFFVEINGVEVKVLGTSFNVSGYATERFASVTLVEGLVSVETEGGEQFRVTPSERFTLDKQTNETTIRKVDANLYTSWIDGKYIFKEATLEEIFEKLHHWYDFSITYADNSLRHKRFSLVVDRQAILDQLLEIISYTSNVKLERDGNSIHVKQEKED